MSHPSRFSCRNRGTCLVDVELDKIIKDSKKQRTRVISQTPQEGKGRNHLAATGSSLQNWMVQKWTFFSGQLWFCPPSFYPVFYLAPSLSSYLLPSVPAAARNYHISHGAANIKAEGSRGIIVQGQDPHSCMLREDEEKCPPTGVTILLPWICWCLLGA